MNTITLGSLTFYPFGICIAVSALLGLFIAIARAGDEKEKNALSLFAVLAFPLGFLFSRLGYCLCLLDWISDDFIGNFLAFTDGGFLYYGTLAGCLLALFITCRAEHVSFGMLADRLALPAAVTTALCCAGAVLAGQGYGWGITDWFTEDEGMSLFVLEDSSFFTRFPFALTDYYGTARWAVCFLEAVVILLFALFPLRREKASGSGSAASLFLMLYASAEVLIESMRQDDVLRWGFVRINQVLSVALLVILVIILWKRYGLKASVPVRSLVGILAGVILCGLMEFALEKKISLIEWMPMDVCYLISAIGCAIMFLSADRTRRAAYCAEKELITP